MRLASSARHHPRFGAGPFGIHASTSSCRAESVKFGMPILRYSFSERVWCCSATPPRQRHSVAGRAPGCSGRRAVSCRDREWRSRLYQKIVHGKPRDAARRLDDLHRVGSCAGPGRINAVLYLFDLRIGLSENRRRVIRKSGHRFSVRSRAKFSDWMVASTMDFSIRCSSPYLAMRSSFVSRFSAAAISSAGIAGLNRKP